MGINYNTIHAQLAGCTSPGLPPCRCNTAEVLCDVQELNGVTYQMSTLNNAANAPSYFCYPGDQTSPHNATWYAFPAYCTNLSLQISYTNCTGSGTSRGLQAAVYSDCNNLPGSLVTGGCGAEWTCVFPFTNCQGCGVTNGVRTLNLSGLIPGSFYYLLVDGCGGSACTVTIQITSPPCPPPPISIIPQDPMGPADVCAGQQYSYTGVLPAGATFLHWFVNNVQIGPASTSTTFNYTFPSSGTYELCLDVSNNCIPVSDPPAQRCMEVIVKAPNAGNLSAMPNPTCPDNTINYSVSGHNTDYSQYLVLANMSGQIVEVTQGTTGSFTHNNCSQFTLYSYNFQPGTIPPPAPGNNIASVNCSGACCAFVQIPINFSDSEPPAFIDPPSDITLSCYLNLPPLENLDWTDNCLPGGSVMGNEISNFTNCGGGTVTRTWSVTDGCNNTRTHIQTITIVPIPVATFIAPPDLTISCNEIPPPDYSPAISYSNGITGNCSIEGNFMPQRTDAISNCTGTITFVWSTTDPCGRLITHTQVMTVEPPSIPVFTSAPADLTVDCSLKPDASFLPALDYTNNESGNCLIAGTGVIPVRAENINNCIGTVTYTWTVSDPCNRTITHVQVYTINPPEEVAFINPPVNMNITCDEIPVGPAPSLAFSNGETGSCQIDGSVSASLDENITNCSGTLTYTWTYTDLCNRTISHTQVLTLTPPDEAVFVNAPPDVTITCDQLSLIDPTEALAYSNGLTGNCEIMGMESAVTTQQITNCAGTITRVWNTTDACGRTLSHTQNITVQAPPAAQLINPSTYNNPISCQDAISFGAPDITFSNNFSPCPIDGNLMPVTTPNFDACGGNIQVAWDGTDNCERPLGYSQTIIVEKASPPVFTLQLPADITVDCADINQYLVPLEYSNNLNGVCRINGSVMPVVSQNINACGGSITLTWAYDDNCGNNLNHQQVITVLPAPQATFINPPPAAITMACNDVPLFLPVIYYSNGQSGLCDISGWVQAIQSGDYDVCGGTFEYNWQYTDECGRTIVFTQVVTVTPAPDPVFINPPVDFYLPCGVTTFTPGALEYSNNLSGTCEIYGSATPFIDNFGTYLEANWTYQNPCNNNSITTIQRAFISPIPDIVVNPASVDVCEGTGFNLASLQVTNQNNNPVTLSYHSGTPASAANMLPFSNVSVYQSTTFYIVGTNTYGCTDEAPISLNVIPTAVSGSAQNGTFCLNDQQLNLWDYIFGYSSMNGFWTSVNIPGLNLDNPAAINIPNNVSSGTYAFDYTVPSTDPQCPSSTTRVFIEFIGSGSYQINNITCNAGFTDYNVSIFTQDLSVTVNSGVLVSLGAGDYEIRNIPINTDVIITFSSFISTCNQFNITISAPNCACPNISSLPTQAPLRICADSPNPVLTVLPGSGFTANWYSEATGGTLLQGMSASYTPTVTSPGLYNFWVEKVEEDSGCKSSTRTQVQFEIINKPMVSDAILSECDNNNDGFVQFNLNNAKGQITSNPGNNIRFFITLEDAISNTDSLPLAFVNTQPYTQTIWALVRNMNNCVSIAELELLVRELPDVNITTTDETCLSDGDGMITITYNSGSGNLQYSLDNQTWTDQSTFNNLIAKNYTVFVRNEDLCVTQVNTSVDPGQRLDLSGFSSICSDNGTSTDGTDDFIRVLFTVSSTVISGSPFIVEYRGDNYGVFEYGDSHEVRIPADLSSGVITFTDTETGCMLTRSIGPLNPCSTECQIGVNGLSINCNDNNTETDNSDDYYTLTFHTSVTNGGSQNMYSILVNNVIISSYNYGDTVSFTLPANGTSPTIIFRDNQNLICTTQITVPDLIPCSNTCLLSASISNIQCNDSGTINDPGDDTFTFTIRVSGFNTSSGWILQGDNSVRQYNTNVVLGPFPISGGNLSLTILDTDDNQCTTVANIIAPPPCSAPCVLELQGLQIGVCNNGGTGNTTTDDRFSISFRVTVSSGSASIYRISNGIREWGPFIYGNTVTVDDLPADGSTITLSVLDQSNPGCNFNFNVSQNPCSQCTETADAGPDIELSCQVNTAQLNGTSSAPGVLYRWTGPNNFVRTGQSAQTSTPGVYYFTVTFADQCVAVDSMTVTVDADLPVANAGQDGIINCIVSEVVLTGTSNIPPANALYEWTDLSGNVVSTSPNLSVSLPGIYFLQVINTLNNCVSGKDEVFVIDDRDAPIAVIYADPGNLLDCVISSIILSGEPQDNVYFDWQVGEVTYSKLVSIVVTEEGLVTMIAVDSISGCSASSQLNIIDLQDYPILMVEPAAPITCDNNQSIISASGSPGGPNLVFSWYDSDNNLIPGQNGSELVVNTPGTYYVVLSDTLNKCSNADTILVESIGDFPDLTQSGDVNLFCGENQANLEIQILNNQPNTLITWSNSGGAILSGTGTERISVQGAGQYMVEVIFPDSGCKTLRTINVNVNEDRPENISVEADNESCAGNRDASISIESIFGGTPPYNIRLNNQNYGNNTNITSLAPGNYNLLITDSNGCTLNREITLDAGNNLDLELDSNIEINRGDTVTLEVKVNLPESEIQTVKWSPSENLSCDTCLITNFSGVRDSEYAVTIIDINGCESTARVRISVNSTVIITVPNIFNPQSTRNNYFSVSANNGVELIEKLRIFDRWGNLLFSNENFAPNIPEAGWDGKYKGQDVIPGVYVFYIEYRATSGIEVYTGDVTIIR